MGSLPAAWGDFAFRPSEHERFPRPMLGVERGRGLAAVNSTLRLREKLLFLGRVRAGTWGSTILTQGEAIFRVQILSGPSSPGSPTGEIHVQRAHRLFGPP